MLIVIIDIFDLFLIFFIVNSKDEICHCAEVENKVVQTMRSHGISLREVAKSLGGSLHFVQKMNEKCLGRL